MKNSITLEIDRRVVTLPPGMTIKELNALQEAGIWASNRLAELMKKRRYYIRVHVSMNQTDEYTYPTCLIIRKLRYTSVAYVEHGYYLTRSSYNRLERLAYKLYQTGSSQQIDVKFDKPDQGDFEISQMLWPLDVQFSVVEKESNHE